MNPLPMFRYNWQIRDEWLEGLAALPEEEWTKPRVGGHRTMLRTLAHIVAVEHEWITTVQGVPDVNHDLDDYPTPEAVKRFSDECRPTVESFLLDWGPDKETGTFEASIGGKTVPIKYAEAVGHLIAHEIHHAGQLSVWAREAGMTPPSPDVVFRGLF
ncbi:DinB family protein [Paenibacillus flagellatus]|nr:DinB family protein [Paenibacillus flagellatus]